MKLTALLNNKKQNLSNTKGFTLIELLVVIGILGVLLAITLIAINPAHQFALARDTQRKSDANTILNSVHQYLAEKGTLPPSMASMTAGTNYEISDTAGDVNLCANVVPLYVADLPHDPRVTSWPAGGCTATGYDTGYKISVGNAANNRVTVTATLDDGSTFTATR